jgi:hypothetical protein
MAARRRIAACKVQGFVAILGSAVPATPYRIATLRFSPTAHSPVTPRDSHLIAAMEKRQLHLQESLVRIRTFGTIFRILYPYSVTSRYPP